MKKQNRPWGNFKIIYKKPGITIKIITVAPNSKLSLQSHKMRDEMWMLLKGKLYCQIDYWAEVMNKEKNYYIPRKEKHRLMAVKEGGSILEISFGEFNEKDIIRYEDDYGRI